MVFQTDCCRLSDLTLRLFQSRQDCWAVAQGYTQVDLRTTARADLTAKAKQSNGGDAEQ
jgi:hypothetical protein